MGDRPVLVTAATHAPGGLWTAWLGEPLAVLALAAATWCYARGTASIWRRRGRGRVVTRGQAWAWGLGAATLLIALGSPLEALAGSLFSAHMVQHVLLTSVAAPLLVLARPIVPLLQGLPHPARRRAARWHEQTRAARGVTYAGVWPLAVAGAYAAVTLLWHLPGPYQAALDSAVVHALEHATMLGVAVLLWWVVRETGRRSEFSFGAGIVAVFAVALTHVGLGAVLTFAPHALYPDYVVSAEAVGLGAMSDQQFAGLAMWVPGKLVHGAAVVVLAVAWIRASEVRARARVL